MPLVLQTSLGGGVGRLNHEALREEVHRFVENNHTMVAVSFYFAAMQQCTKCKA